MFLTKILKVIFNFVFFWEINFIIRNFRINLLSKIKYLKKLYPFIMLISLFLLIIKNTNTYEKVEEEIAVQQLVYETASVTKEEDFKNPTSGKKENLKEKNEIQKSGFLNSSQSLNVNDSKTNNLTTDTEKYKGMLSDTIRIENRKLEKNLKQMRFEYYLFYFFCCICFRQYILLCFMTLLILLKPLFLELLRFF